MAKYVLIVGGKSDIAVAVAREYAKHGYDLYLAGRNISELENCARDIALRHSITVTLKELDLLDFASHQTFYNELESPPLGVIVVAGFMAEQEQAQKDWELTLNTINVNYTGAVSLLNIIANDFEERKKGFIIGISSVAGDRGRKANYIYGSSKAAFSAYLGGLRNRLFESGVHVLTVKPGFVNTRMTAGLNLPAKLTAQPTEVAKDIFVAQQKGKNILYTKSIWILVMTIINNIPEFLFKRLSI